MRRARFPSTVAALAQHDTGRGTVGTQGVELSCNGGAVEQQDAADGAGASAGAPQLILVFDRLAGGQLRPKAPGIAG